VHRWLLAGTLPRMQSELKNGFRQCHHMSAVGRSIGEQPQSTKPRKLSISKILPRGISWHSFFLRVENKED
jgi:hypothetical protein